MVCPPDIAEILLEIIKTAVLRIRALGWSGNAAQCAIEADHVHNLPALLGHYSPDQLSYYLDVSRPSFIQQAKGADVDAFEHLWASLERASGSRSHPTILPA
jgi:hypothetical protein